MPQIQLNIPTSKITAVGVAILLNALSIAGIVYILIHQ